MSPPAWQQTLDRIPFAVVDVETTGLNPAWGHRVCEIAVLRGQGGEIVETFSSLVDPQRSIAPGAFAVNQITPAMLRGAPLFGEIADELLRLLEGAVMGAHNAPFDLGFLRQELALAARTWPHELVVIDTLTLCRLTLNLARYGLSHVGRALGVLAEPEHRALADVQTTWGVLQHLLGQLAPRGILALQELVTWQGGPIEAGPIETVSLPPSIAEALSAEGPVLMRYADAQGHETERLVQPIRVNLGPEYGYLIAYCYLRNAQRTFRLDRVIEMIPESAWSDR
jgi:DNA polymerase-3 subunit epsilon